MKRLIVIPSVFFMVMVVMLIIIQPGHAQDKMAEGERTDGVNPNLFIDRIGWTTNSISTPTPARPTESAETLAPPVGTGSEILINQYPFLGPLLGLGLSLVVVSLILINRIRRGLGPD